MEQRQPEFERNKKLEELLMELNSLLAPVEEKILERFTAPQYPVIFIVGAPRAGSTLMMQWLANTGCFAYPSNLISRFYAAPYVGAKIQLLVAHSDYNFRNEILDFSQEVGYSSSLGKTKGALSPNEFWYFWRRFIPNREPRSLDDKELLQVRISKFLSELAAIEAVFDKPLALKAMIMELNLPFLSTHIPNALFLYIKRHPFYNAQSLLFSREKYYNDRRKWYSIKPKEYSFLADLSPAEQVAGQVYFTNLTIEEDLEKFDPRQVLKVNYEDFCSNPKSLFQKVQEKLIGLGMDINWNYTGRTGFKSSNRIKLNHSEVQSLLTAYERFSGEKLNL